MPPLAIDRRTMRVRACAAMGSWIPLWLFVGSMAFWERMQIAGVAAEEEEDRRTSIPKGSLFAGGGWGGVGWGDEEKAVTEDLILY